MSQKTILLVEDNPDDEELAVLAFEQSRIANEMVVVRDGQEALDYLLGPDAKEQPQLVLLDLKLPKGGGAWRSFGGCGADAAWTRRLPNSHAHILREEEDLISSYNLGANSYVRKPVGNSLASPKPFAEACKCTGWCSTNLRSPRGKRPCQFLCAC